MKAFKIKVTKQESEQVQKEIFKRGYKWANKDTFIQHTHSPYLILEGPPFKLYRASFESSFDRAGIPEITFQDFKRLYMDKDFRSIRFMIKGEPHHLRPMIVDLKKLGCTFTKDLTDNIKCIMSNNNYPDTIEKFKELHISIYDDWDRCNTFYLPNDYVKALTFVKDQINSDNWKPIVREAYFGDVKFDIYKGYADTEYGRISFKEINDVINHFIDPPKLAGFRPCIMQYSDTNIPTATSLHHIDAIEGLSFAIGCKAGKIIELINIRDIMWDM